MMNHRLQMNRLLLLLLAALALPTPLEANPFSGDIVYKTDLGEKYIVKKSAVAIRGKNKISIFKYKLSGKLYRELSERYRSGSLGQNMVSSAQFTDKRAAYLESIYEKTKKILDKYDDKKIISYEITYKPIFQNINNFKLAMQEKSIICLNPLFKNESFIKEFHSESLELNLLDEKVCQKFAKF